MPSGHRQRSAPDHAGHPDRHRLGDPAHLDRRGDAPLHPDRVHPVRHQPRGDQPGQDRDDRDAARLGRHDPPAHPRGLRGAAPGPRAWRRSSRSRWARRRWSTAGTSRNVFVYGVTSRRPRGLEAWSVRVGRFLPAGDPRLRVAAGRAGPDAQARALRRGERAGRARAHRRAAVPGHRRDGVEGAVPRLRHRRLGLHPGRAGHADVQPRRPARDRRRCRQRLGDRLRGGGASGAC